MNIKFHTSFYLVLVGTHCHYKQLINIYELIIWFGVHFSKASFFFLFLIAFAYFLAIHVNVLF